MPLERTDIERLIPHAGTMVLLDRVADWNATGITCVTEAHLRSENPLRRDGSLPAVAGVEIAGQAMAVHGALLRHGPLRHGRLASLRDVRIQGRRLDTVTEPIVITALLLNSNDKGCIYSFRLSAGALQLLSGRATVFFT